MKACETIQKGFENEQSLLAKQLNEKRPEETGELSAAAKQEMASEAEAGLSLWCQNRSKKILEDLYLAFRNRLAHDEGLCRADPAKCTQLLLQAMNGVDRGADLSTMLMWFISQIAA